MVEEDKLLKVHHDWMLDIFKRMKDVLESNEASIEQKYHILAYWIKQGLKVEREE